eukprot:139775_1
MTLKLIDELIVIVDVQQDEPTENIEALDNISARQVVFAFIHDIESEIINHSKIKGIDRIRHSLSAICKICYLFFWGKYPTIYLLNGSGEDGDEYHCNGLLLINLNDCRFNYLNIYDINHNNNQLITLQEDWDKEYCGICCIESVQLSQNILNRINNNNILNKYTHYNIIYHCGGTTINDCTESYDLTAIIYHPRSKKTHINSEIISIHGSNINMDAIDAYQIELPSFKHVVDFEIVSEEARYTGTDITACVCVCSRIYGVIALFQNGDLLQFDWNNSWEWNQLANINNDNFTFAAICLIKNDDVTNEQLFVCGVSDVNIYSFINKKWSYIWDVPWNFTDVNIKGGYKTCHDSKRQKVYVSAICTVYCYDLKENKWENGLFPSLDVEQNEMEGIGNYIFLDSLNGDFLYIGAINCPLVYIDINCMDKWIEMDININLENTSSFSISSFSAVLNVKKQTLFLSRQNDFTQIQFNNNHISNYNHNASIDLESSSQSIIINDSLFIIGGSGNNSIWKWHSETKTLAKYSDMYNKTKVSGFGMVHDNKNNYLLLFGGYDWDNSDYVDYILEFNINTKQWSKMPASLPKKTGSIACTMAINNKYVLLFGGEDDNNNYCDNIFIYSIKNQTIKESKIKCPSKGIFSCIAVNDNIKDEKITFGYIRKQWEICNINNYFL